MVKSKREMKPETLVLFSHSIINLWELMYCSNNKKRWPYILVHITSIIHSTGSLLVIRIRVARMYVIRQYQLALGILFAVPFLVGLVIATIYFALSYPITPSAVVHIGCSSERTNNKTWLINIRRAEKGYFQQWTGSQTHRAHARFSLFPSAITYELRSIYEYDRKERE